MASWLYGRGWTSIYMGDKDGVDQVKKEGEGVNLEEARHMSTPMNHAW